MPPVTVTLRTHAELLDVIREHREAEQLAQAEAASLRVQCESWRVRRGAGSLGVAD